ncbi:hypothetical protein ILUMI_24132 [Ignelater luminosus]|uniref:Uncharacterized protein n=1 Tax=Ignelater luminosus TaxID=2038154 RepID=A0A8K0CB41_IGNLU|nr:hypothetical protein ILUMI_24132 [Ignelater luminosus]
MEESQSGLSVGKNDNLGDPTFINNDTEDVSSESEELDIEAETPINLPDDEEPEDEATESEINWQARYSNRILQFIT